MADGNGPNGADALKGMHIWYEQAGTPMVHASHSYDPQSRICTITLKVIMSIIISIKIINLFWD